jgi:hypothetical protein
MRKSSVDSEFRIDASIDPPRRLDAKAVFVEAEATIPISEDFATAINRELGSLLADVPPNPWSPTARSSFQELAAHPASKLPGTATIPLSYPRCVPIFWQLQSLHRSTTGWTSGLRSGIVVECDDRAGALAAFDAIAASIGAGSSASWNASLAPPHATESLQIHARPIRVLDALEQVDLSSNADLTDDTYSIGRQRHSYDGIPTLIELWGHGDYVGRTWIMLTEDVAAHFGTVDLEGVKSIIAPDLRKGLRLLIRNHGHYLLVNELSR